MRGFGGGDDEVARREREGTIESYERGKRLKKEWQRAQAALVNSTMVALVERVCLHDAAIAPEQLPAFRAAL